MRRILITAFALASALAANTAITPAPARAAEENRVCQVQDVAAFGNRVHVRCQIIAAGEGLPVSPFFFSVEANNPLADKILLLGAQAMHMNKPLFLTYEDLPSQNPPGCLVQDCRRLTTVWLVK